MRYLVACAVATMAMACALAVTSRCWAHNGGILIQLQDNQLAIGADSEVQGVPPDLSARVFTSLLSDEYYTQSLPSFLSRSPAPASTQEIPPGTSLYWDFLPMNIEGSVSNLWYWSGAGTTPESVSFTQLSQDGLNLGLYNVTDTGDNRQAVVTGTTERVEGGLLGVTDTFGDALRLHRHNYFVLDDGDGVVPTNVPEGVYLIAMQLRMEGVAPSDPFFVVTGTYDLISTSIESLDAAALWVEQNQQLLVPTGDYNFDGLVDTEDYSAWKQQFGSTGPFPSQGVYADGNRDGVVDLADYTVWRNYLGAAPAVGNSLAHGAATVPEPPSLAGLAMVLAVMGGQPWHVRRRATTLR